MGGLRRQQLVGLAEVSTVKPGSCERIAWSLRHGWGEDPPSLLRFSAEWLGETCRSYPASSYQRFLLFKLVLASKGTLPGGAGGANSRHAAMEMKGV